MSTDSVTAVKAFDLLYLKGKNGADKCYLDVALKDRIKGLRMCFTPLKGRLEFCTSSKGKTISDLRNALEVIVSTRFDSSSSDFSHEIDHISFLELKD